VTRLALLLVPLAAVAVWITSALRQVDAIEREIRPVGGLAYATFVQLTHNWATTGIWTQTVHRGYADDWRWGGHYTPLLFLTAKLASLSESPWALARVQVAAVGLGGIAAWGLGRAEAGVAGGLMGLAMYLASGPVLLLALSDYQDLVFVVPFLPLAVWAARHGSTPAFVAAAVALGSAREEAVLLLPVVGASGGWRRGVWGLGVTLGFLAVYKALGAPPYPNPLGDILGFQVARAREVGAAALVSLSPNLYGSMAGAGWPWLLLAPVLALPAAGVALFHAQDPTGVGSVASPAIHHLAPLTAASITAGIVGSGWLMRRVGKASLVVFVAVLASIGASAWSWRVPLQEVALRGRGTGPHPAWGLLEKVPPDAGLLVPEAVAPAAARRARVVTLDSLGDRVRPSDVRYALDDGRLTGTVLAETGGWRLLADPVLPKPRDPNTSAPGAPQPAGGRQ
jgi:hypothetical protein